MTQRATHSTNEAAKSTPADGRRNCHLCIDAGDEDRDRHTERLIGERAPYHSHDHGGKRTKSLTALRHGEHTCGVDGWLHLKRRKSAPVTATTNGLSGTAPSSTRHRHWCKCPKSRRVNYNDSLTQVTLFRELALPKKAMPLLARSTQTAAPQCS